MPPLTAHKPLMEFLPSENGKVLCFSLLSPDIPESRHKHRVRSFFRLCPEQSFLRWFSPRGSFLFCFSFHCSQCIYAAALYELYSNAHPAFVFILITLRLRLSLLFLHHSRRSLLLQRWFPPLLRTHRNCPLPRIPLLLRSRSLLPRVPGSRS